MKNAHSVGAVDFLSSLVGKKLPNPSFTLTQPMGMNFQKISDKQLKIDPVNVHIGGSASTMSKLVPLNPNRILSILK